MFSALRDSVIAQQALRLGAMDYLPKPVDLKLLEQTIAICLDRMEYRDGQGHPHDVSHRTA